MAQAKITLIGLERYRRLNNESLFDDIIFPEGISKPDAVNVIMMECGEFETLYPDPDFLQEAITLWGVRYYRTFDKWVKALALEYDPIENYDRREEWTEEGSGSQSGRIDSAGNNAGSSQTDTLVSAYDGDALRQRDRVKGSTSDVTKNTSTSEQETEGKRTHVGRIHGNIGVTTSQQMLESELELARFDLLGQIADLFKQDLCVSVYY